MSGVAVGRARDERMCPVTEWAIDEVCSLMEVGVIQVYVG